MHGILREFLQRGAELTGPLRSTIIRLEGPARFSGTPLMALYFGSGQNLGFLEQLFFESSQRSTLASVGNPLQLRIGRESRTSRADLFLGDLPPLWQALLPDGAALRLPAWLSQVVDLPESGALLPRKLEREVGRHRRQRGYRVEFSNDEGDARHFYREFYVPYLRSRFGPDAVVIPETRMIAQLRGKILAKLYQDDRWLLGLALAHEGKVVRFGWFGSAQNPPPVGASETLDWLCIQHAKDLGARQVVMGSSRPCLSDGIVRYKLRFGARFTATRLPPAQLAICALTHQPAVFECLRRQPLIRVRRGLTRVYRVEQADHGARVVLKPLDPDSG
jgi:hypothetical protein